MWFDFSTALQREFGAREKQLTSRLSVVGELIAASECSPSVGNLTAISPRSLGGCRLLIQIRRFAGIKAGHTLAQDGTEIFGRGTGQVSRQINKE